MERLQQEMKGFVQTSTAIGHVYAPPLPFHTDINKNPPLRPVYKQRGRVSRTSHYTLTSQTEHDPKDRNRTLGNVVYSKAPSHWNTNFQNDLVEKLKDSQTIKLISEPVSEMHDCYRGPSALQETLDDHHRTKLALYGQLQVTPALMTVEPMLSTTQMDYKSFSRSKLTPPASPIKGILTKSGALSHLPPHKTPPNINMAYPKVLLPHPILPLPHRCRSSLYMDSFPVPAPPTASALCAASNRAKHKVEDGVDLLRHILEVPKMYNTQNQTYGNKRIVLL